MSSLLVGALGLVIWQWAASRPDSDETVIEKEFARKLPWGRTDELAQLVAKDPLPAIQLLTHPSPTVRGWAEEMLFDRHGIDGASDHLLDRVSAELSKVSSYKKTDLIRILTSTGQRGILRLIRPYQAKRPVKPELHWEISTEARRNPKLGDALLAVAKDETLITSNRRLAAEAARSMNDAATNLVGNNDSSAPEPDNVDPDPGDEYSRAGDSDVVSPAKDGGVDALAALKDRRDWLRTGYAAAELARHGITGALSELERVAATHWYAPVRTTAEQAIRTLRGQEPPASGHWILLNEQAAFEAWDKSRPDPARGQFDRWMSDAGRTLKPVRNALVARLQPEFDRVVCDLPDRLPYVMGREEFHMQPKEAIAFAGGKLLGYDNGEFGAGTVFYRKRQTAQYFLTPNVVFFYRIPSGVLVFCDAAMSMTGDKLLYLAREGPEGKVSVDFFMRLPGRLGPPQQLPSGETQIPSVPDDILISSGGKIRSVPHVEK